MNRIQTSSVATQSTIILIIIIHVFICLSLLLITEGYTSPLSWSSCLCSLPESALGARLPRPCRSVGVGGWWCGGQRSQCVRGGMGGRWNWGRGASGAQLVGRGHHHGHLWSGLVPPDGCRPYTRPIWSCSEPTHAGVPCTQMCAGTIAVPVQ